MTYRIRPSYFDAINGDDTLTLVIDGLDGRYPDSLYIGTLRQQIFDVLQASPTVRRVTVDLGNIEYLNADFIHVLTSIRYEMQKREKGNMRIVNIRDGVREKLEVTHLNIILGASPKQEPHE